MNKKMKALIAVAGAIFASVLHPTLGMAAVIALIAGEIDMVEGSRATNDLSDMRMKVDMDTVSLLNPSKNPFVALMTRINKKVANAPKFWHIERQLAPRWDTAADSALAIDTEIEVSNADYFTAGDIIVVPRTGERMLVTAIEDTADHITVSRSMGATEAAVIVSGDEIQIIGNAKEEGAVKRAARAVKGEDVYDYTQIFETVFGVSNTSDASDLYGEKDIDTQRKEWGMSHAIDLNRAAWFGEKGITTGSNGKPLRLAGGLIEKIETGTSESRVVTVDDALTEVAFDSWLDEVIENDPEAPRVIFISRLIARVISTWAKDHLELVPADKTYGIRVMKYRSAAGDFNLIVEPLFKGAIYGGYAVAVPMKECFYRPLKGRDTYLETNVQLPGEDQKQDLYRTEAGFMFRHPEKFGLMKVSVSAQS